MLQVSFQEVRLKIPAEFLVMKAEAAASGAVAESSTVTAQFSHDFLQLDRNNVQASYKKKKGVLTVKVGCV